MTEIHAVTLHGVDPSPEDGERHLAEDPAIRACKVAIARILSGADERPDDLFKGIHSQTGHGRVIFERAISEMVGIGEAKRIRKKVKMYYAITEAGRKKWLRETG